MLLWLDCRSREEPGTKRKNLLWDNLVLGGLAGHEMVEKLMQTSHKHTPT